MSKELQALQALNNIKELVNDIQYALKIPSIDNELDIIESALKEKEKQDEVLKVLKRCYEKCPDNNKIFGFTHYDGSFVLDTFVIGNACFLISEKEKDLLKEILL